MPSLLLTIGLLGIYLTAWLLQSQYLLHQDVSAFTHWAEQLLAGGSYSNNYFETNPPLIIYLSIPPVLIAKYFSINLILSTQLYIFFLITLSLLFCKRLIHHLFKPDDDLLENLFFMTIAIIFLIAPLAAFGQREHLLVVFGMPYILLLAARLQSSFISTKVGVITGLFASIAFALKPFFLFTPLLLELFFLYKKRRLFSLIRPELLTLVSGTLTYIFIFICFHRDYFTHIVPFIHRYYYAGVAQKGALLITFLPILPCWITYAYYFTRLDKIKYHDLVTVLILALTGFLCAYFIGRVNWFYHALPAYLFAIIIFTYLFFEQIIKYQSMRSDYLLQALCSTLLIILALRIRIYSTLIPNLSPILISVCLLYSLTVTAWYFFFTPALSRVFSHVPTFAFFLLFSTLPLVFSLIIHQQSTLLKKNTMTMQLFLAQHAKDQSIYFLSTNALYFRPVVDMTHTRITSRFPFLWMLPGMFNQAKHHDISTAVLASDQSLLNAMICEDITRYQPKLIFIDTSKNKIGIEDEIDYFSYLNKNHCMENIWKNYHLLTTLNIAAVYPFYPASTYQVYTNDHLRMKS